MASLADIPPELLHADKWTDFIHWLRSTVIDPKTRAELGRLWAAETMTPLDKPRWQHINATPILPDTNGPQ